VQHFLLRLFLLLSQQFPWRLVPFPEEAEQRIFLSEVDGKYMFVHRLLLDYFASLEKQES
jgi:hypothetical protein